jgi:ADP-ribose pyrophosphatase YjhB (NUDIX family)
VISRPGRRSLSRLNNTPDRRGVSAARQVLRRPYRYALALVLACASLLTLILLYADRSVSLKDKLTQIGTALAGSIIFAVIYTIFANREFSELIKAEITGQLTDHMDKILHDIKQLNELFLPTDQYPATREFNPKFNRDITADMCHSSSYFFRGTSAKYVPARLSTSEHHLELAQVILLDPRDRSAIDARAADRRRRPEHDGKAFADIELAVRNEILLALVALFDCRDQCDIEIGFSATTSPVRIEIFDRAIYTSLELHRLYHAFHQRTRDNWSNRMTRQPHWEFNVLVGAATVHDGSFLLLRRSARESFLPQVWGIPAGQIHPAEDPRAACLRELHEETGLHGEILELIGYSTFVSKRAGADLSNIQLNFLVQVDEREVTLNKASHSASIWISLDDVESDLVDPFTRDIISSARVHHRESDAHRLMRR